MPEWFFYQIFVISRSTEIPIEWNFLLGMYVPYILKILLLSCIWGRVRFHWLSTGQQSDFRLRANERTCDCIMMIATVTGSHPIDRLAYMYFLWMYIRFSRNSGRTVDLSISDVNRRSALYHSKRVLPHWNHSSLSLHIAILKNM